MKTLSLFVLAASLVAATADPLPLIPKPVSVETKAVSFTLSAKTAILYSDDLESEAKLLAADIGKLTGSTPRVGEAGMKGSISGPTEIDLSLSDADGLQPSGYVLNTNNGTRLTIRGKDAAGVFHGTRTLLQLLPAKPNKGVSILIPGVKITDHPRFAWRGMMLDSGRHFVPVNDVKTFIDQLAYHKFSVMHWHLTEDQGWRIEIKKYPKLTEVGSWRDSSPPYGNRDSDDGVRYGGFYTQEQIKDIVAYATARHITIVPEIEMPGHAAAAITAYPELGNSDIPGYAPKVMTRWGVHPYIFAPKDETFTFLEDVLTEVCSLFPGKFIHIGGDEAPKTQWKQSKFAQDLMKREGLKDEEELQSWFIRRIGKFLESKNRNLIGWDEIQEGGLPKTATMMVWRDAKWGKHALSLGNNVVMATTSHTYFDYYQNPKETELAKGKEYEAIAGYLPLEKVYSYNPTFIAETSAQEKQILGTQAQLWSEYFKDFKKVQYMAFPRIAAIAEVAWTPQKDRSYPDFLTRLDGVMNHYEAAGIPFSRPLPPPKKETKDGSTVSTSLGSYQNQWPELAFDGRDDTFFWADRALKEGDHFTLKLKAPLAKDATVTLATGGKASHNGDKLENGALEASSNGTDWKPLATFENGSATAQAPAGTSQIRLKVTQPQENWLIIHEITVK